MPLVRVLRSGVVVPVVATTAVVAVARVAVTGAERHLFASIRGPRGRRRHSWAVRTAGGPHGR